VRKFKFLHKCFSKKVLQSLLSPIDKSFTFPIDKSFTFPIDKLSDDTVQAQRTLKTLCGIFGFNEILIILWLLFHKGILSN